MSHLLGTLVGTLIGTLLGAVVTVAAPSTAGPAEPGRAAAQPSPPQRERPRPPGAQPDAARYSLLQMNLCSSGFASCFERHPRVVEEAIGVIAAQPVDAVALNEACSGDVARIARETGYHARFAPVLHDGRRLPCVRPRGRGVFGNAVMTRRVVAAATHRAFTAQAGTEERRWICVRTADRLHVCGTHLSTRDSGAAEQANDRQCREFAAVLAARRRHGRLLAAGDFNRRRPCTPGGMWARSDADASRLAGSQHGYGSAVLQPRRARLVRASHTDHAFLLMRARLVLDATRPRATSAAASESAHAGQAS